METTKKVKTENKIMLYNNTSKTFGEYNLVNIFSNRNYLGQTEVIKNIYLYIRGLLWAKQHDIYHKNIS